MKTIHDNPVSSREMVRMIILFVFGSSVVMGVNPRTMQDAWICLLIAAAISVPVFFIYARIMHLMDGKDFFTCVLDWFGGIPGRIVIALLVWYYLYLAAVVVRNFSEFMEIVAMPETPQVPMMISFLLVSAYLCKSRIQVISQWSIVGLCITVGIMIITVLSTVASMRPQNLLPILEHSPPVMMKSSFEIFAFPFAECVVFLPLISAAKHGSPYKIFFKGLFYSTLVLMVIILRNVLTLGPQLMEAEYFPSYSCARIMGSSFELYHDLALLNPKEPVKVCNDIQRELGIDCLLVDANDLSVVIFGKSDTLAPVPDQDLIAMIKDNPAGQSDELTPLILIKKADLS